MNPWIELKDDIAKKLNVDVQEIQEPEKFGEFAFPCFKLGNEPSKIAAALAAKLKINGISEIKALGPYLNFYIDWNVFGEKILSSIDKDYGKWKIKETCVMDVFQANPFKSFHIGHVRNAVLGESIRRILEFTGRKTVAISFNGDVGIHVSRWLLYFNEIYEGDIPKNNFTKWSGEIYAKATTMAKDDPDFEERAQELNRKLDKGDKSIFKKWKKMRDLCYKDFENIRKELDVKVDKMYPESECVGPGKKTIMELYKNKKLKESEGAVGLDLGIMGFFILLKKDGTALYATKDIGLLSFKLKYKPDMSIYVVGSEQDFYLKQLFKTFDILNLVSSKKCKHVSHGMISLKEGKMASRLGNVILYEDLRDETVQMIVEKYKTDEKKAKDIALGAIKFFMLKFDNIKEIKFDWDEALSLEGKTGPYLQYTYARACGILGKGKLSKADFSLLKQYNEIALIKRLAKYPGVVKKAADEYSPHVIAEYLFELCQEFNTFYQAVPVLNAERPIMLARLKLVEAFRIVLKSGLNLLGIKELEKM